MEVVLIKLWKSQAKKTITRLYKDTESIETNKICLMSGSKKLHHAYGLYAAHAKKI